MDKLSKEYKQLVRSSWRLFYLSHRVWAKPIEELGLSTSTFSPLEIIVQNPGVNQQVIANELSLDKSCMSRSCKFLETNGFITREKSRDCTHGFLCYPTEKALDVYQKIMEIEDAHIHALFSDVNIDELENSISLLKHLVDRLNTQT